MRNISLVSRLAGDVLAETLWPTRCALCDAPGKVLCERCERGLPYIDWWRACRRCGSAYGLVQCDACAQAHLERLGLERFPFAACASAVEYAGDTGQLVRVFKDQGEQRLAGTLARLMARALPPGWDFDAVTFVPATVSAFRCRGFDHAELIAVELSAALGVDCARLLARPSIRDQRGLGAAQRIANLSEGMALQGACGYRRLLLVDDVMTTGATLCAASRSLLGAGAQELRCLTFARV